MKAILKALSALSLILLMVSCDDGSIYAGFKKMDNGAYMTFYSKGDSETMPRLNDEVTIEMAQYFNDSLLLNTAGDKPLTLVLKESDFVGDVTDGLLMMHVGDSARLVVSADSVLTMLMGDEIPAEYAGKPIYYDLKLLSVKPFEVLEAERRALLDSLILAESAYLAPLREDPNNTVAASGLVVMELAGKGKTAKLGQYVDFDFLMCDPKGDTIMNSFGVEPVVIQYGEEFSCKGFNEALGMVPEGGTMRFVMPSALAFDSTGYEPYIKPYTPIHALIRMNSVMDKADYDKKQAALAAAQEAEKARREAAEQEAINDYIKDKGIAEAPTESGLYIFNRQEGEGNLVQWGDTVSVHYVMRNLKEEQIESSYDYGRPMTFVVGSGSMVPAIEEALMTMAPHAKVSVVTPSALAFGATDLGETLPPYSPLRIELELVEVK